MTAKELDEELQAEWDASEGNVPGDEYPYKLGTLKSMYLRLLADPRLEPEPEYSEMKGCKNFSDGTCRKLECGHSRQHELRIACQESDEDCPACQPVAEA